MTRIFSALHLAMTGPRLPVSIALKEAYWQKHKEGWHRTPVRRLEGGERQPPAQTRYPAA